jgi:hypothetical protein
MFSMLDAEKKLEQKERRDYDEREWTSLDALFSRMHALTELSGTIDKALGGDVEDGSFGGDEEKTSADAENEHAEHLTEPSQLLNWKLLNYQWSIRPEYANCSFYVLENLTGPCSFSTRLKYLHDIFQNLLTKKENLERRLQVDYRMFGPICDNTTLNQFQLRPLSL